MSKQTRYDLVTDVDTFYNWLDTCPVHWRHRVVDGDYIEIGFFSVLEEEQSWLTIQKEKNYLKS